ncbi:MAG: DUF58 domain-containing protein [Thioalkalispiraceae bacterium]|jgi:uncharacterized protein (DUF58 family)
MQWSHALDNTRYAIQRLSRRLLDLPVIDKWFSPGRGVQQPLLGQQELAQLHAMASSSKGIGPASLREVKTLLAGERYSTYSGSGYEFAENQRYVAGDDSRFINWRLLARTGQLYRKVFYEERRPQLWLVMDKRASMRFGSRQRLKVTQAAILAIHHLYQAQHQQLACGGVVLTDQPQWHKAKHSLEALQALITDIVAPAPPLHASHGATHTAFVLRQLEQQVTPGSIIVLISDFIELDNDNLAALHSLASRHSVLAWHVIDPIEQQLPEHGRYQVSTQPGTQTSWLDCDNPLIRQQYRQTMHQREENIKQRLLRANVSYQRVMTDENIVSVTGHE